MGETQVEGRVQDTRSESLERRKDEGGRMKMCMSLI